MINKVMLSFEESDFFPLFLDYDFKNGKCRGNSLLLDFLFHGQLSDYLTNINSDLVYILKEPFFFKKGFFLYDFVDLKDKPEDFYSVVDNLSIDNIFLEESRILDEDTVLELAKRYKLTLVRFF